MTPTRKVYLRSTRNLYYKQEKPNLKVFYSYVTPVALEIDGQLKVSENQWSVTTARHLTWIDGGNKKARLKRDEFNQLLKKHKPEPNFLKTVSMVSAMFGLMSQDQKKTNDQKKRFFDKVQGINFPDDWETLSEEEKSKRLEKVEKVGLSN
jgi:D-mannonate dehydratase